MFLGLPSFFSFLEGLTNGHTIPVACEILEATRATFLEVLFSSVDTPGSAQNGPELKLVDLSVLSYSRRKMIKLKKRRIIFGRYFEILAIVRH